MVSIATLVADVPRHLETCRRAREAQFDLIVMDVMLPGKDGFEAI
jgi:CheY-like chemotaxis protein